MDLFSDLPEPGESTSTGAHSANGGPGGEGGTLTDCGSASKGKRKSETDDIEGPGPLKKPTTGHEYILKGHAVGRQGEREEMQDVHVVIDDAAPLADVTDSCMQRLSFYAVYDGHAGARAAQHCGSTLHTALLRRIGQGSLESVLREMKRILVNAYKKTDETFLQLATKTKPSWKDGTTATTVLVINDTLFIANLGDSKAILLRDASEGGGLDAVTLTKDHNPTDYNERMRIQKAGGVVRDGRVNGQLEVSRSIGDGQYKTHGVTCMPDVRKHELTPADRYLLIACDGLWKGMKNEEVSQFVTNSLQKNRTNEDQPSTVPLPTNDEIHERLCRELAGEAIKRLSGDNVTVLLVSILRK